MQKGFSAILVIVGLAIVLLVGGGLFYVGRTTVPKSESQQITQEVQSTPSTASKLNQQPSSSQASVTAGEIAKWKSYTNDEYKFSFKYPTEWTYADSSDLGLGQASEKRKSGYQMLLGDPNNTTSAGEGKTIIAGSINVQIYNKGNYAYFSEDLNNYYKSAVSTKQVKINNLEVNEVHHTVCPSNDDCISVIFKKGDNIFSFDTWVWNERNKDLDTIYKILSTFKSTQ